MASITHPAWETLHPALACECGLPAWRDGMCSMCHAGTEVQFPPCDLDVEAYELEGLLRGRSMGDMLVAEFFAFNCTDGSPPTGD